MTIGDRSSMDAGSAGRLRRDRGRRRQPRARGCTWSAIRPDLHRRRLHVPCAEVAPLLLAPRSPPGTPPVLTPTYGAVTGENRRIIRQIARRCQTRGRHHDLERPGVPGTSARPNGMGVAQLRSTTHGGDLGFCDASRQAALPDDRLGKPEVGAAQARAGDILPAGSASDRHEEYDQSDDSTGGVRGDRHVVQRPRRVIGG